MGIACSEDHEAFPGSQMHDSLTHAQFFPFSKAGQAMMSLCGEREIDYWLCREQRIT